jgi:putative toxin-antitoxin system antitoxin component (TIGR02293 family)
MKLALKQPSSKSAILKPAGPKRRSTINSPSGIVDFCVHGKAAKPAGSSSAKYSPSDLVELIESGLPVRELDELQVGLGVPMEKLFPILGISKTTGHRRKAAGKLDPAESDRVVRLARLLGRAIEVMESEENARRWLSSPQFGLGGAMPLEFAKTEAGAREVEALLGRIEFGVYS